MNLMQENQPKGLSEKFEKYLTNEKATAELIINKTYSLGKSETLKKVFEEIDIAKKTSGYIGIGEWDTGDDIDRFFKFLEELTQKLKELETKI